MIVLELVNKVMAIKNMWAPLCLTVIEEREGRGGKKKKKYKQTHKRCIKPNAVSCSLVVFTNF